MRTQELVRHLEWVDYGQRCTKNVTESVSALGGTIAMKGIAGDFATAFSDKIARRDRRIEWLEAELEKQMARVESAKVLIGYYQSLADAKVVSEKREIWRLEEELATAQAENRELRKELRTRD